VWIVEIAAGTPATPHCLTREEVFVVMEGQGRLTDGSTFVPPWAE
jgi:mannose-6-phosphate isomerase-like protein (cupin superfamily)